MHFSVQVNLKKSVNDNILLTGETLGSTYHGSGEGIGKAMETRFIAAKLIDEVIKTNNFNKIKGYPQKAK